MNILENPKYDFKPAIALHTGAGFNLKMSENAEKEYKNGIHEALTVGWALLKNDASCVDIVEAVCCVLENNPLFNAGLGSVLNSEGYVEMDASIMEGKFLKAGAVANVKKIKNPIKCARLLLEENNYIFFSGNDADEYASKNKLEIVYNEYFLTDLRLQQLHKCKSHKHDPMAEGTIITSKEDVNKYKLGTIGVVCLDQFGDLAAGTSTGGTYNKPPGRIGDSAVIGGGTYANNETCAVSCTGKGEHIMRNCTSFTVHSAMSFMKLDLKSATELSIKNLSEIQGSGGLISVDKFGNVEFAYNTGMMGRGYVKDEKCEIFVYDISHDLTPTNYNISL
jgi:beta-aspartyl-peptidase (threonine type)